MLSVLWEIFVSIPIAFGSGLLVGFLLWRRQTTSASAAGRDEPTSDDPIDRLEPADATEDRNRLERELEAVTAEVTAAATREAELLAEFERSRSAASAREAELLAELERTEAVVSARGAELEALGDERAATSAREAELLAELERTEAVVSARGAELEALGDELAATSAREAELLSEMRHRQAETGRLEPEAGDDVTADAGGDTAMDWQEGTTALGTVGADHTDDLQAISGIGPELDDILNGLGIRSWEQLAILDESEVELLDGAIDGYAGRIERDEWVAQAQAFMANGHEPVDWSSVRPAPGWASGVTRLGTFGAEHRDDLKVIDGIGLMMESILNEFGITTWEQIAAFNTEEIEIVNSAIETFPGRIERDRWVDQAKDLSGRFPDPGGRPTSETLREDSGVDEPGG